jgi:hypothetical protein
LAKWAYYHHHLPFTDIGIDVQSQEEGLLSPKKKDKEEAQPKMPLADAIESVRSNNEPYNWVLCSF